MGSVTSEKLGKQEGFLENKNLKIWENEFSVVLIQTVNVTIISIF